MKILFVLPEFTPQYGGGIATYYKALIPALTAAGHDVDILVGSAFTNDHPTRTEEGYTVEFLNTNRRERATEEFTAYEAVPPLRRTLGAAWALFQQSDRGAGYDLVEINRIWTLLPPLGRVGETPSGTGAAPRQQRTNRRTRAQRGMRTTGASDAHAGGAGARQRRRTAKLWTREREPLETTP